MMRGTSANACELIHHWRQETTGPREIFLGEERSTMLRWSSGTLERPAAVTHGCILHRLDVVPCGFATYKPCAVPIDPRARSGNDAALADREDCLAGEAPYLHAT